MVIYDIRFRFYKKSNSTPALDTHSQLHQENVRDGSFGETHEFSLAVFQKNLEFSDF